MYDEIVTHLAMNGHYMDYRVSGYSELGHPITSSWNATHSDKCPCLQNDDGEDSSHEYRQDW